MSEALVVVRAGDNSLHESFGYGPDCGFDLMLSCYTRSSFERFKGTATWAEFDDCGMGQAMRNMYGRNFDRWSRYDYLFFPGDDIRADGPESVRRLFEVARFLSLEYAQPAITGHVAIPITVGKAGRSFTWAGYVETMCPIFSFDFLSKVVKLIPDDSYAGWGFDDVISAMASPSKRGRIDCVTVEHTRPAGSLYDRNKAMEELLHNHKTFGVKRDEREYGYVKLFNVPVLVGPTL